MDEHGASRTAQNDGEAKPQAHAQRACCGGSRLTFDFDAVHDATMCSLWSVPLYDGCGLCC